MGWSTDERSPKRSTTLCGVLGEGSVGGGAITIKQMREVIAELNPVCLWIDRVANLSTAVAPVLDSPARGRSR